MIYKKWIPTYTILLTTPNHVEEQVPRLFPALDPYLKYTSRLMHALKTKVNRQEYVMLHCGNRVNSGAKYDLDLYFKQHSHNRTCHSPSLSSSVLRWTPSSPQLSDTTADGLPLCSWSISPYFSTAQTHIMSPTYYNTTTTRYYQKMSWGLNKDETFPNWIRGVICQIK